MYLEELELTAIQSIVLSVQVQLLSKHLTLKPTASVLPRGSSTFFLKPTHRSACVWTSSPRKESHPAVESDSEPVPRRSG